MLCESLIVPEGNAVVIPASWRRPDGEPDTPTAVAYQVFDFLTGAHVCPLTSVTPVAAEMEFTIPPSHVPATTAKRRRLVIQVTATFTGPQDTDTRKVEVYIERRYVAA